MFRQCEAHALRTEAIPTSFAGRIPADDLDAMRASLLKAPQRPAPVDNNVTLSSGSKRQTYQQLVPISH
jgi:hypothetical protein